MRTEKEIKEFIEYLTALQELAGSLNEAKYGINLLLWVLGEDIDIKAKIPRKTVNKLMKVLIPKKHYRILKYIVIFKTNDAGWFRIFGVGIKWKHEKLGLLFSERIGKRKYIKIGSWIFGYLPKASNNK